jgi:phage gp45-like
VPAPTWKVTAEAQVQHVLAVEGGAADDALDFLLQLLEFGVQVGLVAGGVGAVGCLHGQFAHPLEVVGHGLHRAFSGLRHGDTVVGVADRHVEALGLGVHAVGNCQARRVVLCAIDAKAGRQALHRSGQAGLGGGKIALCIQRHRIGVDSGSHFGSP